MEFKYYLQELSDADARSDEEAILRFPSVVKAFAPQVECHITRLDDETASKIQEAIAETNSYGDFLHAALSILCCEESGRIPKLVVCCDAQSQLAMKAKETNPNALWGAAPKCGQTAAVYRHEPALVWHEMLHLLCTDDCYTVDANGNIEDRTCGHDNCIMQYAPTVEVVGDPPFLCDENVQRIRATLEAHYSARQDRHS